MNLNVSGGSSETLSAYTRACSCFPACHDDVDVPGHEHENTLSALSDHYLTIANGLSLWPCASLREFQVLRSFSEEFNSLSSTHIGPVLPVWPPAASLISYHHVANFAMVVRSNVEGVIAAWMEQRHSLAHVFAWLKGYARAVLASVRPTSMSEAYCDVDSQFFRETDDVAAVILFAPFTSLKDKAPTIATPATTPSITSKDRVRSMKFWESDEDDTSSGYSSPSESNDSHSRYQQLVLEEGARFLAFDGCTMSYSGKSDYYSVERNVVLIHESDARDRPSRRPPVDQGYEVLSLDDPKSISWRRNIGRLISGAFLSQMSQTKQTRQKSRVPWTLGAFPSDYVLTRRTSLTRKSDGTEKKRTDVYLYGSSCRFSSPAEFAAHAIWLMRGGGMFGDCVCKVCSGSPQSIISAVLEQAVKRTYTVQDSASFLPCSRESRATKRKCNSRGDLGETSLDGPSRRVKLKFDS